MANNNKLKKKNGNINIKNKRAEFDYLVVDRYTAGIVLTGTEIKSIRAGKAGLVDTYCYIHNGEMWVKNMYVAEYDFGSYNNHVSRRDRKLLLNKRRLSICRMKRNHLASPLCRCAFSLMKTGVPNLSLRSAGVRRNMTNVRH